MIRKNLINCKLFFQKASVLKLYDDFMQHFNPDLEVCPSCGAKGCCKIFAYYERSVVELEDGKPSYCRIRIARVRCSCGHTHAILPDMLIPYRQYSLPFILHVLKQYYTHSMTLERIYDVFAVSHTVLYRWLSLFGRHARIWLGMRLAAEFFAKDFLQRLIDTEPFSAFTSGFYRRTLYSFLQTHANPANCRHLPAGFVFSDPPPT